MSRYEQAALDEMASQQAAYEEAVRKGDITARPPDEKSIRIMFAHLQDPVMPNMPKMLAQPETEFYRIGDGRVWDIKNARFVDGVSDNQGIVELTDGGKPADLACLIKTLRFYNYELGAKLLTTEELFERLRAERDLRIAETDYLMNSDYPISADKKAAFITYRQALRDMPSQPGAPWDGGGVQTPWPVRP